MERERPADRDRRQADHLPRDGPRRPTGAVRDCLAGRASIRGTACWMRLPRQRWREPVAESQSVQRLRCWAVTAPTRTRLSGRCLPGGNRNRIETPRTCGPSCAGPPAREGVVHLDDLLLRRVRLGLLLPHGGLADMDAIRAIAQPELGWDDARWRAGGEAVRPAVASMLRAECLPSESIRNNSET